MVKKAGQIRMRKVKFEKRVVTISEEKTHTIIYSETEQD